MTTSLQKDALLSQFSVLAYKDRDFLNDPGNLPSGWALKVDSVSSPFAALETIGVRLRFKAPRNG